MNNEKILSSATAIMGLIFILLVVFAIIQLLILAIFDKMYWTPGVIIFLIILLFCIRLISGTVKMNDCVVLLEEISKSKRAVFEGFYWKLPTEKLQYTIDLEGLIAAKITETHPTTDGSIKASASILSKPNSGLGENEDSRSRKMVKYARFTRSDIQEMQGVWAKSVMRPRFANLSSEVAKSSVSENILKKSDFSTLEDEFSIRIIECPVFDIDYSDAVQEAQNAKSKAITLAEMTQILVSGGEYTTNEAKAIAPLLMKEISLKKNINDVNFSGLNMSPKLIEAIDKLIEKLIEKFGGN